MTFSWSHNETSITTTSDTSTGILTITSVGHSDAGSYVCTVRSGSLSVMSNAATLTVYGMSSYLYNWYDFTKPEA